jgi:primosomal replication protein N''
MNATEPQFVKLCPSCKTERPAAELICEHILAGHLCHWDLTSEPVYVAGVRPRGLAYST